MRFRAVIALIGVESRDGRTLAVPAGGLRTGVLPLPVGDLAASRGVGYIDALAVEDNRLVANGFLDPDSGSFQGTVERLRSGWRMALYADETNDPGDGEQALYTSWRVRAATVTEDMAWDVPPVVLWEAEER